MNITDEAAFVSEEHDYGEGYYQQRFGFRIGEWIFMVGVDGYGTNEAEVKRIKSVTLEIIKRWNAGKPNPDIHVQRTEKEGSK